MPKKINDKEYGSDPAIRMLIQTWRERASQRMLSYITEPGSIAAKVSLWEASILENCAIDLEELFL